MTRTLSKHETYEWLRSTLQQLASLPRLNEDAFAYTVFEELDADVRSALSEFVLGRLGIAEPARNEIAGIRSAFLALVDAEVARNDARWVEVSGRAEQTLSAYMPERRSLAGALQRLLASFGLANRSEPG
jgi:hypothetical protein